MRAGALACAALLAACGGAPAPRAPHEDLSALYLRGDARAGGVALTVEGAPACLPAALDALAAPAAPAAPAPDRRLASLTVLLTAEDLGALPPDEARDLVARLSREGHEVAPRLPWSPALDDAVARAEALSEERARLAEALHALGWRREPPPPLWRPSGGEWRARLDALSSSSAPGALAALWTRHVGASLLEEAGAEEEAGAGAGAGAGGRRAAWDTARWRAGDVVSLDLRDPPGAERCAAARALGAAREALGRRGLRLLPLSALLAEALAEELSPTLALSARPPITAGCARLFGVGAAEVAADEEGGAGRARWSLVVGAAPAAEWAGAGAGAGGEGALLALPLAGGAALPSRAPDGALERLWSQRGLWWGAGECVARLRAQDLLAPLPPSAGALTLVEEAGAEAGAGRARVTRLAAEGWGAPRGRLALPSHDELLAREAQHDLDPDLRGLLSELAPREDHLRATEARGGLGVLLRAPLAPGATAAEARAAVAGVLLLSAHPLRPYRALALLTGDRRAEALAYAGRLYAGPLLALSPRAAWGGWARWRGAEGAPASLDPAALALRAVGAGAALRAGEVLGALSPTPPLSPTRAPSVYGGRGGLKASLLRDGGLAAAPPPELWRLDGGALLGEQRLLLLAPPGARPVEGAAGW